MENEQIDPSLEEENRTNYIDDDLIAHMDRYGINIRSLLEKKIN